MNTLPPEQIELIDRFIRAYNDIDHCLREHFNAGPRVAFSHLVKEYKQDSPRWRDGDQLLILADLRNFLVHEHQ